MRYTRPSRGLLLPIGANNPRLMEPHTYRSTPMTWTKPEAEVVAVTMEVTAYVATL